MHAFFMSISKIKSIGIMLGAYSIAEHPPCMHRAPGQSQGLKSKLKKIKKMCVFIVAVQLTAKSNAVRKMRHAKDKFPSLPLWR